MMTYVASNPKSTYKKKQRRVKRPVIC